MEIIKYFVTLLQEPGNLVVERREERPVMMNAFELISTSQGLNLGTLFEKQMVCCGSSCLIFYVFRDGNMFFALRDGITSGVRVDPGKLDLLTCVISCIKWGIRMGNN